MSASPQPNDPSTDTDQVSYSVQHDLQNQHQQTRRQQQQHNWFYWHDYKLWSKSWTGGRLEIVIPGFLLQIHEIPSILSQTPPSKSTNNFGHWATDLPFNTAMPQESSCLFWICKFWHWNMDHNLLTSGFLEQKCPFYFSSTTDRFLNLWDLENLINVRIYISKQSNLIVTFLLF